MIRLPSIRLAIILKNDLINTLNLLLSLVQLPTSTYNKSATLLTISCC